MLDLSHPAIIIQENPYKTGRMDLYFTEKHVYKPEETHWQNIFYKMYPLSELILKLAAVQSLKCCTDYVHFIQKTYQKYVSHPNLNFKKNI